VQSQSASSTTSASVSRYTSSSGIGTSSGRSRAGSSITGGWGSSINGNTAASSGFSTIDTRSISSLGSHRQTHAQHLSHQHEKMALQHGRVLPRKMSVTSDISVHTSNGSGGSILSWRDLENVQEGASLHDDEYLLKVLEVGNGRSRASSQATSTSLLSSDHGGSAGNDHPMTTVRRLPSYASPTSSTMHSPTGSFHAPPSSVVGTAMPVEGRRTRPQHTRVSSFSSVSSAVSIGLTVDRKLTSNTRPSTPPISDSIASNHPQKTPRPNIRRHPRISPTATPSRRQHEEADLMLLEAVRALEIEAGFTPKIRHNSLASTTMMPTPQASTLPSPVCFDGLPLPTHVEGHDRSKSVGSASSDIGLP
jgi:hypothetical protein